MAFRRIPTKLVVSHQEGVGIDDPKGEEGRTGAMGGEISGRETGVVIAGTAGCLLVVEKIWAVQTTEMEEEVVGATIGSLLGTGTVGTKGVMTHA